MKGNAVKTARPLGDAIGGLYQCVSFSLPRPDPAWCNDP